MSIISKEVSISKAENGVLGKFLTVNNYCVVIAHSLSHHFIFSILAYSLLMTEGNIFIKSPVFDQIPKSLLNVITGHLLVSHAALEQWKLFSEWYVENVELLKELNVSKQIPEGN